ncbi:hypothetical protein ACROYT_G018885 [Oculina patagonica]
MPFLAPVPSRSGINSRRTPEENGDSKQVIKCILRLVQSRDVEDSGRSCNRILGICTQFPGPTNCKCMKNPEICGENKCAVTLCPQNTSCCLCTCNKPVCKPQVSRVTGY